MKNTKRAKVEFDDLLQRVMGCAIEVHRHLGLGLLINFNVTNEGGRNGSFADSFVCFVCFVVG